MCCKLEDYPNEHQMSIKWWLGQNTSPGSPPCALCPEHPLDPLGHHAVTCKRGGDAISRHNKLRDVVLQTCHRACISAKAEAGSGLGHELRNTRPADILASNWLCGKPSGGSRGGGLRGLKTPPSARPAMNKLTYEYLIT